MLTESPARGRDVGRALTRLVLGAESGVVSAPRDAEQARELLQSRLTQLSRINVEFSALFLLLDLVLMVLMNAPGTRPICIAHTVVLLYNLALWQRTRTSPRALAQLQTLDLLAIWGNCGVFVALGWRLPAWTRPELVQLLCVNLLLGLRAFLVPSSAGRTLALSSLPVAAVVVSAYSIYSHHPLHPEAPAALSLAIVCAFFGLAVLLTVTLTSRTIYGLRERVLEAYQLGQYTLLEKIGEGGMGIVYKARHALLRRPTAIKLLPPERAGHHNLARFEREVQLTSALTHPNTVAVYDYGRSADGLLYYAMEYLDGLDLEALVALDGPQPPGRVVHILLQVCGALAEAHAVGLIHRDIKPGNLLLCARGGVGDVVKVVDFGLVKDLSAPRHGTVSGTQQLVGTPLFMSPEAIADPDQVSSASDLYAVGAVAYFLLTGQPPFSGSSIVEVCGHHLHTPAVAPSARLGRALPAELERVVARCLEKSPERRPASALALAGELERCTDVPAWSSAHALDWWREHAGEITERKRRPVSSPLIDASTLRAATVAVDLQRRG